MAGEKYPLIEHVVSPSLTVKIQLLAPSVRFNGEVVLAEDVAANNDLKAALYALGNNAYVKILFSEEAEEIANDLSQASEQEDDAKAIDGLFHQILAKKAELETATKVKLDAQIAFDADPESVEFDAALATATSKVTEIESALADLEAQLPGE